MLQPPVDSATKKQNKMKQTKKKKKKVEIKYL